MIGRILLCLISCLTIGITTVHSGEYADVHYNIRSTLDYPGMTLFEHTQIIFRSDSICTDSLLFWRIPIEKWLEIDIDSIFVNGLKLDLHLTEKDICLPWSSIDQPSTEYPTDSLTFHLPAVSSLETGINTADFYYTIRYTRTPDTSELSIPESFMYIEYFPRLANAADSISNFEQRWFSYDTFSLTLTTADDFYVMSEAGLHIAPLDSVSVEYSVDTLETMSFIWFAFPKAYSQRIGIGSVQFDVYIDPEMEIDEHMLREISEAMAFYGDRFGNITYEKVNVLFISLPGQIGGAAASNFMLLPAGCDSYSLPGILSDSSMFHTVLAHETAHLWWGCSVGISDTWLSEGLASYWADQYAISTEGQAAHNSLHFDSYRLMYRLHEMFGEGWKKTAIENISHYYKAPYILNMLSLEMGSDNLTETCRVFYESFSNKSPGLKEFIDIAQRHSEAPLDSFFACWVDSNFSQNYAIKNVESKRVDSLYQNYILLEKTGRASSHIPLAIRYKDDTDASFVLRPGQLSYTWSSPDRLASVFIDPHKLILETQRKDNAWPTPILLHTPRMSLSENFKLYLSVFDDEPGYHLYLFPDIPRYSERYGWDFSAAFVGKHGSMFEKLYMEDIDILRFGYNTRSNGAAYQLFKSMDIASTRSWTSTCNVAASNLRGKHEFGVGFKYGRTLTSSPMNFPELRVFTTIAHRRYYTLQGVDGETWPERDTTPITLQLSAHRYVPIDIEFERGFGISDADDTYYRHTMTFEKKTRSYSGRLFIGTSGGDAVQERFDPSHEGGMKGYPPFRYYHDRLVGINLLLKQPIIAPISMRAFGNHINPMTGGYSASELGFGFMVGTEMFGFIVDMPVFLSETDIDGKKWNLDRFRIQLNLFSISREPTWDFLID